MALKNIARGMTAYVIQFRNGNFLTIDGKESKILVPTVRVFTDRLDAGQFVFAMKMEGKTGMRWTRIMFDYENSGRWCCA